MKSQKILDKNESKKLTLTRMYCIVKIFLFLAGLTLLGSLVGSIISLFLGYLVYILGLPAIYFPMLAVCLVSVMLFIVSIYIGRKG